MVLRSKKGQTGGLVTGLVAGVAGLVISVILAFVIVTNVSSIDDNIYTTLAGGSADNESIDALAEAGDALTYNYLNGCEATVVTVYNETGDVLILASGNYTVSGCSILGVALSDYLGYDVQVTYTTTYQATTETADMMIGNLTSGVDNVSGKIPTVLLVAAIDLILGVLALLVGVWQRMRIGGGNI